MSLAAIKDDFATLDAWEDRFRYVIELGRGLQPLDPALRTDANKVRGCASQVWLDTKIEDNETGDEPRLRFAGESDALIVRGLIAILFAIVQGKTPSEILAADTKAVFDELGLNDHLTPQRSNGLASMVRRIESDAKAAANGTPLMRHRMS